MTPQTRLLLSILLILAVVAIGSAGYMVIITLSVRTVRTDLQIIARAEHPASEAKLKRAGASRAVCTQVMGALRISNILTRPNVVDLVEMANKGVDLEIDEYVVTAQSAFAGQTLRESKLREETGASVVAIKRDDGETVFNPGPDSVLKAESKQEQVAGSTPYLTPGRTGEGTITGRPPQRRRPNQT